MQLEKLAELQQRNEMQLKEQQYTTKVSQLQAALQEANDRSGKIRLQYERYLDEIACVLNAGQALPTPQLISLCCLDLRATILTFHMLAGWVSILGLCGACRAHRIVQAKADKLAKRLEEEHGSLDSCIQSLNAQHAARTQALQLQLAEAHQLQVASWPMDVLCKTLYSSHCQVLIEAYQSKMPTTTNSAAPTLAGAAPLYILPKQMG